MQTVKMVFVGGFLGAGKTTLLWEVAKRLMSRGQRVGLITNDQAPELVDTGLLSAEGAPVREVAGSCFCCNFAGLIDAAESLHHDVNAQVLVAEPVGSCTDLSATILQPLKDRYRQQFALTPLSVLVDPDRVKQILGDGPKRIHDSAAYIVRKQIEESDMVVINKVDKLSGEQREEVVELVRKAFPEVEVRCLSAQTGEGVDEWLDAVLSGERVGQRVVAVDYDKYAEGEAVLGWLNASIRLEATQAGLAWKQFATDLVAGLQRVFRAREAETGHLKLLLSSTAGRYVANLTQTDGEVTVRGSMHPSPVQANLTLNARVEMSPADLEQIVREQLAAVSAGQVKVTIDHLRCLSPGRPMPTHRYAEVVES